jgi:lipoprotein-anchoring transpeptidase ErfK/SrfK
MSVALDLSISRQELRLLDEEGKTLKRYNVSTARNGPGERNGSECTPRGAHLVRAKIGTGCPVNTVFKGRRPTGEIYSPALRREHPGRDWILTRILWLSGRQRGFNRLGDVDTMRRFIYIHGAPDDDEMGVPGSHGCIKMRNGDVVELFDLVTAGTPLDIRE